ncbi:MAG: DNA polymerase I, partial [Bacilli bacterium]|nr:DNA polymerase I [Bacilli bacterium]
MFNRRRYISELKATNYQTREFGKRMAMNAPIQGSAADILKIAMVKLKQSISDKGLKTEMVLQIHDELVFSVPVEEQKVVAELVTDVMENCVKMSVPLVIDSSFGNNLYEVKDNA